MRFSQTWYLLTYKKTVGDVFDKPLRFDEAQTAKDALAKFIYAQLFNLLVDQVRVKKVINLRKRLPKNHNHFITLDI